MLIPRKAIPMFIPRKSPLKLLSEKPLQCSFQEKAISMFIEKKFNKSGTRNEQEKNPKR